MKQTIFLFGIAAVILQSFSCKGSKLSTASNNSPTSSKTTILTDPNTTSAGSELLYMYRWYLSELNQKQVRNNNNVTAHLSFSPGKVNTVTGFTGCNRLSGTFALTGLNEVKFAPMAVTEMACLNEDKTEGLFLTAIQATNKWRVQNKSLFLYNGETVVAKFTAVEAAITKLEGNWELNYISGVRIAFDGLYPDKKPTIRFELGLSMISGNTSCNGFSSNYTITGNSVKFAPPLTTMMACDGNGEMAFTDMLQKVNKYALSNDNTLNFLIDDVAVMRFIRN